MKKVLEANIDQQNILSKIMEAYDKQRLASIDKYFGMASYFSDLIGFTKDYMTVSLYLKAC